jgi:acyl-CoA thioesterase
MKHPFAEHISLAVSAAAQGRSRCELQVAPEHLNPHAVVHGAVIFALADTGMGAALYTTLQAGESCATVEIKVNFYRPVASGRLVCETQLLNRGKSIANLESRVYLAEQLVASANGTFAIFARKTAA